MKSEGFIHHCVGNGHYSRQLAIILLVNILCFLVSVDRGHAASNKKVKELCIECHSTVNTFLKRPVVHKPVKDGKCTACHNPHVSRYAGLLSESSSDLCYKCHERKNGFEGAVIHKPVEEGKCLVCHDPHASKKTFLLDKSGGDMCFSCHPKKEIMAKKNIHPEVKKGNCASCHAPHATNFNGLLLKDRKKVCSSCHYPSGGKQGKPCVYEVKGSDCVGCHSPHSSDRKALVKAQLHAPFENRKCSACHDDSKSFRVESSITRCLECHKKTMESFNTINSHLMAEQNNSCVTCHNPHASDENNLFNDNMKKVCFECHSDSEKFVDQSNYSHPALNICSDCHVSHGSNNRYFLSEGSETCSAEKCHPSQGTFVHPVGEDVIDPRSNSSMDCTTCHNAMGSPEKFILRFEKDRELCLQCHPG